MSRDVETFSCWKCKTIFYLEKDTWKDIKENGLKVFCPRCRAIVFKGGFHEARS